MIGRSGGRGARAVAVVAAVAVAGLTMNACGSSRNGDVPATTGASVSIAAERPASTGMLTIVSPTNGKRIAGDTAQLEIDLQGATIVDQTSTDLQPDEGHLHVVLDGELVSMTSGTSQLLGDLTPGDHLVQVEFVANDHAPFDPRVLAAVTFEVKG
ncbi:MAG: hypothetical protein ACXWZF_08535 [Actinomycetota bacterium]